MNPLWDPPAIAGRAVDHRMQPMEQGTASLNFRTRGEQPERDIDTRAVLELQGN